LNHFRELAGMKSQTANKKQIFKEISKELFNLKEKLGDDRMMSISNRQPVEDYVRRNSYIMQGKFSTNDPTVIDETCNLVKKHRRLLIVLNPEGEVFELDCTLE
jgi:DNA gyrase/topoisomerase IV subunit A